MIRKTAIVFLADGFEECEGLLTVDILRRAEVQVITASVTGDQEITSAHGIVLQADALAEDVDFDAADMLVLPGGFDGTQRLAQSRIVREQCPAFAEGKLLGAICAAPGILGELGILEGKRATCHPTVEDKMAGAILTGEGATRDGNIITGKSLGTAFSFALKLVEALFDQETAKRIAESVFFSDGGDMDALDAILTRRSTRKMTDVIPGRDLIEKILEAGRHAPSGSNSQTTHLIVITDRKVLGDLKELVREEFAKMEISEGMYISLKNSIQASKRGEYAFHYNAPVLIVTANQKTYGNAMADSACVLENMMIAANALDLGSCWINQLHWLDENEAIRRYMSSLGLGEDETITGGLILGYAYGDPIRTPQNITGNPVTWVK